MEVINTGVARISFADDVKSSDAPAQAPAAPRPHAPKLSRAGPGIQSSGHTPSKYGLRTNLNMERSRVELVDKSHLTTKAQVKAGKLVLKVIGITNFKGKGPHSNPFLKVIIGDQQFKTHRNPNTHWDEEFQMSVMEDDKSDITFGVFEKHHVRGSHLLDEGSVNMSYLVQHNDAIVPIKMKGENELRVNVHFIVYTEEQIKQQQASQHSSGKRFGIPLFSSNKKALRTSTDQQAGQGNVLRKSAEGTVNKKGSTKILPFRVELKKTQFYPGDIVEGTVTYTPSKPKTIKKIAVYFQGREALHDHKDVEWTDSGKMPTLNTGSTLVDDNQILVLFNNCRTFFDVKQPGAVPLEAKEYKWNFSFKVPNNIPPSSYLPLGKIEYAVVGVVNVQRRLDLKLRLPVHIGVQYSNSKNAIKESSTPQNISKTIAVHKEEVIKMKGALDSKIVGVGQDAIINLDFSNNTSRFVTNGKIELVADYVYYQGSKYTRETKVIAKAAIMEGLPVEAGQKYEGQIAFKIPEKIPSTLSKQNSPIINLGYAFRITLTAKVHQGYGSVRSKIPHQTNDVKFSLPLIIESKAFAQPQAQLRRTNSNHF